VQGEITKGNEDITWKHLYIDILKPNHYFKSKSKTLKKFKYKRDDLVLCFVVLILFLLLFDVSIRYFHRVSLFLGSFCPIVCMCFTFSVTFSHYAFSFNHVFRVLLTF
jgi:xanthine/uracil permease